MSNPVESEWYKSLQNIRTVESTAIWYAEKDATKYEDEHKFELGELG